MATLIDIEYVLTQCAKCGKDTYWDKSLGDVPLCVDCWDKTCESYNQVAEQKRRWYQDNKEKVAEQQRRWYQDNKEKVAEQQRRYRLEHRVMKNLN